MKIIDEKRKKEIMETQEKLAPVTKNEYVVFVVEDSDVYRTLLVESISKIKRSHGKKTNYCIYTYSSGEEALENIHLKPDVVILDYYLDSSGYLANMNGLALLKKIKRLSPRTELIVLSCQTSVEVVKEMLRAGASNYIKKDNFSQMKVSQLIENFILRKEKSVQKRKVNMLTVGIIVLLIIATILTIYFLK